MTTVQQARRGNSSPVPVTTPADMASAVGAVDLTFTAKALAVAQMRLQAVVLDFQHGKVPYRVVEEAIDALDLVATRVADMLRRARLLGNDLHKVHLDRLSKTELRLVGLPLVSIGPSGIGGEYQTEIDAALAPVGNTCPECDRPIPEGTACVRCSMHKGVEDHEFEGGGAFTVDEVRTLAGVCYRVLDCDGQIVLGSQTGSADGARQHAAKLNAGVGHE